MLIKIEGSARSATATGKSRAELARASWMVRHSSTNRPGNATYGTSRSRGEEKRRHGDSGHGAHEGDKEPFDGAGQATAVAPQDLAGRQSPDRLSRNHLASAPGTFGQLHAVPGCHQPAGESFPQLGIGLFGNVDYGSAGANLRILAVFVLLLYLTMPLSAGMLWRSRRSRRSSRGRISIRASAPRRV